MTSLSPIQTIGNQITEAIRLHLSVSKQEATERAIDLLRRVGIPRPAERMDAYTFQLSGGMRQRAMIAMALSIANIATPWVRRTAPQICCILAC